MMFAKTAAFIINLFVGFLLNQDRTTITFIGVRAVIGLAY